VDVSVSHTIRHNHPVRLLEKRDQLVAETATCTTHNNKETNIQPLSGFRNGDSNNRVGADLHHSPSFNIKLLGGHLGRRNVACLDQYALVVKKNSTCV